MSKSQSYIRTCHFINQSFIDSHSIKPFRRHSYSLANYLTYQLTLSFTHTLTEKIEER